MMEIMRSIEGIGCGIDAGVAIDCRAEQSDGGVVGIKLHPTAVSRRDDDIEPGSGAREVVRQTAAELAGADIERKAECILAIIVKQAGDRADAANADC